MAHGRDVYTVMLRQPAHRDLRFVEQIGLCILHSPWTTTVLQKNSSGTMLAQFNETYSLPRELHVAVPLIFLLWRVLDGMDYCAPSDELLFRPSLIL